MIVENVSPTPFALLRRANHFQYRDEDQALKEWSEYEDPIQALTEECRRVLRAISAANQSHAVSSSKHSTSLRDASWSRFEDIGFASALEEDDQEEDSVLALPRLQTGLRSTPTSGNGDLGRPTTPSWADFLSSGFVDDRGTPSHLLPPDKALPPIDTGLRQRSSQSHKPRLEDDHLEPGELASIVKFDLDDAFWWVWMTSLAPEETPERKSVFGRCAVVETVIRTGRWLVMEEIVKGAAPDPQEGAYIAEKKSFFAWARRGKGIRRRKSTGKHTLDKANGNLKPSGTMGLSKTSIGPNQQAKIQVAALQLQKQEQQKAQQQQQQQTLGRRGRTDQDLLNEKTNSVFTLQPSILNEASPAVKWANKYDKEAIREAYLADANAGRGPVSTSSSTNGHAAPTAGDEQHPPELPPKTPTTPAQPGPIVTTPQRSDAPTPNSAKPKEKDPETPRDVHPTHRTSNAGRDSPLPPPKDPGSMELAREKMVSPEPELGPDGKKQKKLHKEKTGGANGLKKLFSRHRNRQSKVPENAAEQLRSLAATDETSPAPASPVSPAAPPKSVPQEETQSAVPKEEQPAPEPVQAVSPPPAPATPVPPSPVSQPAAPEQAPAAESSVEEDASPASTKETVAPKDEFSRFDQGPLLDQPAFVPEDDSDDADEAVPPPVARHPPRSHGPSPVSLKPRRGAAAPPPPPVAPTNEAQDRWAQIRQKAAERAAQRQMEQQATKPAPGVLGRTAGLDDDTSGEESKSSKHETSRKSNPS